jgi:hypothetical protein
MFLKHKDDQIKSLHDSVNALHHQIGIMHRDFVNQLLSASLAPLPVQVPQQMVGRPSGHHRVHAFTNINLNQ